MKRTTHPAEQLKDFLLKHEISLTPDQLGELFNIGLAYWQKGYNDCKKVVFGEPINTGKK
jgi:hypothetical protein